VSHLSRRRKKFLSEEGAFLRFPIRLVGYGERPDQSPIESEEYDEDASDEVPAASYPPGDVDKLCDTEGLSRPSHRGWRPDRRTAAISGKKKNALGNGSLGVLEH
jgi:hypothetical protein